MDTSDTSAFDSIERFTQSLYTICDIMRRLRCLVTLDVPSEGGVFPDTLVTMRRKYVTLLGHLDSFIPFDYVFLRTVTARKKKETTQTDETKTAERSKALLQNRFQEEDYNVTVLQCEGLLTDLEVLASVPHELPHAEKFGASAGCVLGFLSSVFVCDSVSLVAAISVIGGFASYSLAKWRQTIWKRWKDQTTRLCRDLHADIHTLTKKSPFDVTFVKGTNACNFDPVVEALQRLSAIVQDKDFWSL
jgi:hypothetical protein